MQPPPVTHPHVPSERQHVIAGAQEAQRFFIGHDVGPTPELDPPPEPELEVELDPDPEPELEPELTPEPQAPALQVCPTVVQSSQTRPTPHTVSRLPAWHRPLVSQQPEHVPPSAQVPMPVPTLASSPLADPESPEGGLVEVELPQATTMSPKLVQ
jgi:hypothetical protein